MREIPSRSLVFARGEGAAATAGLFRNEMTGVGLGGRTRDRGAANIEDAALKGRRYVNRAMNESGGGADIEEGPLRRWPLQQPILPSGTIGGKYAWCPREEGTIPCPYAKPKSEKERWR